MIKANYLGFTESEMMTKKAFIKAMRTNDASELFVFDPDDYEMTKNTIWRGDKNDSVFVKAARLWGTDATYYRALIVLEYGYMDIEAELFCKYDDETKSYIPILDYFCCRKIGEDDQDWESDDSIDCCLTGKEIESNVDWNADDWEEQLQQDMVRKLKLYCERKGYDYTKPIKV